MKAALRRVLSWLGKAALFVVIALVLDVLLTRFVLPDSIIRLTELERHSRIYSEIYHHGLAANRRVENAKWGPVSYVFATNSLGFKDAAPGVVPLASSAPRTLIIGDSFTEGSGFGFDQTFAGHLREALSATGTEVLNAGVISYSPVIYYRRVKHLLEEVGLRFDELVVFMDISDIDDEANHLRLDADDTVVERGLSPEQLTSERRVQQTKRFLKQNSTIYRSLSELNRARKRGLTHRNECLEALEQSPRGVLGLDPEVLRKQLVKERSAWTYDKEVFARWGERGLGIAAQNMERLKAVLDQHGIGLTVVVYPWPAQLFANDLDSAQARFWSEWARAHGARFVDLFPDFLDPEITGNSNPMLQYSRYFIPCDNHWNAAGHSYVAERYLLRAAAAGSPGER